MSKARFRKILKHDQSCTERDRLGMPSFFYNAGTQIWLRLGNIKTRNKALKESS